MTRYLVLATLCLATAAQAELQWIWTAKSAKDKERASFRKTFTAPEGVASANLRFTCDNGAKALINGKQVAENPDWMNPTKANVTAAIKPGENAFLINATNQGSAAGLLVELTLKTKDGKTVVIESDTSWEASQTGSNQWKPAISVGKYGSGPWGNAFDSAQRKKLAQPDVAIDAKDIATLPGFKVQMMYNVPKDTQGSWVSMTIDPKGRLITCDQYGQLWRVTLPPIGSGDKTVIDPIKCEIGGAHGLLYANDSLYVMCNEKTQQPGLWRCFDEDGDGNFEKCVYLAKAQGSSEHGPHGIALGPDGKSIYFVGGNHTKLPDTVSLSRHAMNSWGEDHILPRMWDANGHARGILAPGGWICKTDPEGKRVELYSMGYRNQYDIAFNTAGDLFTYDSDMEWDMGTPWYMPTRVNHATSGSDCGWRSGQGRWPAYYADSLPSPQNIGPGSPTGVTFGTGAKFPAKYQRGFFINDWTYGTMYVIHLTPDGASYKAEKEEFVSGKPLPLTDVVIHPDGAMYFTVGGRRTQSALYRVTYEGKESTEPAPAIELPKEALQRRELEKLHEATAGPDSIDKAWPFLSSPDRFLRWAARVAIERQPVQLWCEKALAEANPQAALEALMALVRMGQKDLQPKALDALAKLDYAKLDSFQKLALLRVYEVCFTRMGKPAPEVCAKLADKFDVLYPANQTFEDRELCQLLIFLGSQKVVAKTLSLMATAKDANEALMSDAVLARNDGYARAAAGVHESRPNKSQIAYVFALRNATVGWTPELRKQFFAWFPTTAPWRGGNSFKKFLENARTEAMANFVPENERAELEALSTKVDAAPVANYVAPKGPGKAYTLDEVVALAKDGLKGRNFEQGKAMFNSAMCIACHRFNGDGGGIGPDITGASNRYTTHDFVENIIDPSKVISDQYGTVQIDKNDGSVVIGRLGGEENGKLMVMTNPMQPNALTAVDSKDIKSQKPYPVSMMPPGLINMLNQDELLDLIAYVMKGGNAADKAFAK